MSQKKLPLIHFLLMFSLGYVYMFIFSAALPTIADHFSIIPSIAQLTMTIYILGFALSQLIYAPIANAFGRKKALYLGSTLALIGTFLSYLFYYLGEYTAFLIARFIMAFGACVGTVLALTIIADVYSSEERKLRISYLGMTFAIMSNLAIFIGAWVMKYFKVEGIFYFLILFSCLVFYNIYNLPETAKEIHIKHLHPKIFMKGYINALKKPQLWIFGIIVGCIPTSVYAFSTIAPFISVDVFKIEPTAYGYWTLLTSVGIFFGPLFARIIAYYLSSFRTIVVFNILALLLALGMLFLFLKGNANVYSLFILTTIFYFLVLVFMPSAGTLALKDSEDTASSSSVFAFIYIGMSFLGLLVANFLHEGKAYQIPLNFLIMMGVVAIFTLVAKGLKCEKI